MSAPAFCSTDMPENAPTQQRRRHAKTLEKHMGKCRHGLPGLASFALRFMWLSWRDGRTTGGKDHPFQRARLAFNRIERKNQPFLFLNARLQRLLPTIVQENRAQQKCTTKTKRDMWTPPLSLLFWAGCGRSLMAKHAWGSWLS